MCLDTCINVNIQLEREKEPIITFNVISYDRIEIFTIFVIIIAFIGLMVNAPHPLSMILLLAIALFLGYVLIYPPKFFFSDENVTSIFQDRIEVFYGSLYKRFEYNILIEYSLNRILIPPYKVVFLIAVH